MGNKSRSSKKAAKAKISGFAVTDGTKNKKIVFDESSDLDEIDASSPEDAFDGPVESLADAHNKRDVDDDAVEEVKGSTARESTQKLRDAERTIAKDATKKKRSKKKESKVEATENKSDEEDEKGIDLTDDFFKMVDSERANKIQSSKEEKKQKKKEKKQTGKHTTFVVQDEHNLTESKKIGNIEVVTLNTTSKENEIDEEDRRNLLSASLGCTSKSSTLFARGNLVCGSKERSCESRKRKNSVNDLGWKRSKRMVVGGVGRAAFLFSRRK